MSVIHTHYSDLSPYITRDGSEIREILHPDQHAVRNQSLAEAIVPVGEQTHLHRHHQSEEIYFILAGKGSMTLGEDVFNVEAGDAIVIAPGLAHCIRNTSNDLLKIMCCCAPAYSHADTELLD